MALDPESIFDRIRAVSPGAEMPEAANGDRFVVVPEPEYRTVMELLKDDPELDFDSLMCQAGADDGEFLTVASFLHSMKHRHKIEIKVNVPREAPVVESVEDIWKVANYFERETFDLYGIAFRGHPNLRRIMNPDDWQGWPMRKDYAQPATYHGITLEREEQFWD